MLRAFAAALVVLLGGFACTDDADPQKPGGFAGSGGTGGTGGASGVVCPVRFTYKPAAGVAPSSVALAGEWNEFDSSAVMAGPDASGTFSADLELAPGVWAYKLVFGGDDWRLDDNHGYRKYVDGLENSGLRVRDCSLPALVVGETNKTRASAGAGTYSAKLSYEAPVSGDALASVTGVLQHAGTETELPQSAISVDGTSVQVALDGLADGKYTALLYATDEKGRQSEGARLVFWLEPEHFDWRDALIYMIVTDRFKNGDPSNDTGTTAGVQDARGDFKNGDLEGIRQKIADGTLDKLGIRALWLTPFQTNPTSAYLASDQTHMVTGYHGYWPVKAREVDPRLGGEAALKALVKEAHAHGIRILIDYVVNHVHEDHEYFKQHPDWFRTGCVCGTAGCDWTAQALECLFTPYLPDVNWSNNAAGEQFVEDAVWWLSEFDLDGIRVDAVKHVEDAAITNLSTRVRDEFEKGGTKYFLMGETAMGWSDCGLDCNKFQYDTISRYIGKHALDGQFDFVLYHSVPYRVFAYDEFGMKHADFWAQASQAQYPSGSIMTPFIGSHDSQRFVSLATYRGQPGFEQSIPHNQWDNLAGPPQDAEPYQRHRSALAWLMGLPGAPLLYYGDEYGEWGGSDPGNRAMWRDTNALSADEQAVLSLAQKLGTARRDVPALRRGTYRSLFATETVLVTARETPASGVAIVAVSRDPQATNSSVTVPPSLGLKEGQTLSDKLGGPSVTLTGGQLSVDLGAYAAAIFVP
ncbi:MAG TPA: alpha-amylase family glycosyl hydrolase [Polyangiaceae bacterium]|nr:alpha-amylase family glycosyl hydrolase [Polyangiaceae bacterium]